MEGSPNQPNITEQKKHYDDRIRAIEDAICNLCGPSCGTCTQDARQPPDESWMADGRFHAAQQAPKKTEGRWVAESPRQPAGAAQCNAEFPPLSLLSVENGATMPAYNPVDQLVLEKSTSVCRPNAVCSTEQEQKNKVEKDLSLVINETEYMINFGCKQVRHLNAVTLELKLLLTYEQKILKQVVNRIDKFKLLREENKRKATEWENKYKEKTPEYERYSVMLINVPQTETINVDGIPGPVQQKVLFQIVSQTTNTANRVVVHLSMEEAVANDIDLTLQDMKKHCAVMLKQIAGWLKMLEAQIKHQNIVLDRWTECKNMLKDLKVQGETEKFANNTTDDSKNITQHLKPYEERLKRIEEALCKLTGPPCINSPQQTISDPYDQRLKIIEEAICKMSNPQQCNNSPYFVCQVPQGNYNDSLCDPTRGISNNGTQTQQCVSPSPQECSPQHHNFSSISDCYIEDPYLPSPVLFPSFPSPCPPSPCPEVCSPQSQNPQGVCPPHTPVDYFGNPIGSQQTGPCWGSPPGAQNQVPTCPLEYNDLGELRRNRAPPGTFSGIDLVDCPGMGFPVPKAALDRGGRLPGQTVPLTPPPPPPPHMGRFTPLAISSPVKGDPGVLRPRQPVTPLPPNPLGEQPMDPALLPKIQEDLQKLAERNKNLQELVNNFKRIRATLTDAIDKAVKLNQKLQRDLYYVAEAHR